MAESGWLSKKIKRRTFLVGTGATLLAAGATAGFAADSKKPSKTDKISSNKKGQWVPTVCSGCVSWCAVEVFVVDGRVIKVKGNPRSINNQGKACHKTQLSLQELYDPDRLKTPMKRTNPKKGINEDPRFVPISWDEALGIFADKIIELRKNNESHKFATLRGRYTFLNDMYYSVLPKLIGSPNSIAHSSICRQVMYMGPTFIAGQEFLNCDLKGGTKYLIAWGSNLLGTGHSVSWAQREWPNWKEQAKIVSIDPRFSETAAKSHEWLPVKAGEDGSLAIAMAHVILAEGLWSRSFVGNFKDGSNKFSPGNSVNEGDFNEIQTHGVVKWWNLELKDKTPEWAEPITGIPAAKIRQIATEFAKAAPMAAISMGGGICSSATATYGSLAIFSLLGLVGAVDTKGGNLSYIGPPLNSMPPITDFLDEQAKKGIKMQSIDQTGYKEYPGLRPSSGKGVNCNRVASAVLAEDPYDLKIIWGNWYNFIFASQDTSRWYKAHEKIPFQVFSGTNMAEAAHYADIILPATHHQYEQYAHYVSSINYANQWNHVTISQPIIKRMWDVQDAEIEVVYNLGVKLAERGFDTVLRWCKTVKDPETGKEPTNGMELCEYAYKLRTQKIWDPKLYVKGEKINGWKDFLSRGVWNVPTDDFQYGTFIGNFKTPTKKLEFYSNLLKKELEAHAKKYNTTVDDILKTCKYDVSGERAFLPVALSPVKYGNEKEYPFVFYDCKSKFNREGRSANNPWYYDTLKLTPGFKDKQDAACINPSDAEKLGIKDGDAIRITSIVGSLECVVSLFEGVRPGTVTKAFGQGHWAYGRVAAKDFEKRVPRGANNNDIIVEEYDRLSNQSVWSGHTRVKITKI